jgi:hypothetical protein
MNVPTIDAQKAATADIKSPRIAATLQRIAQSDVEIFADRGRLS